MIHIEHLEKKYPAATPLRDVNAHIRRGDVISVIGPSGTGKSTLLRCINMLDPPTKGRIIVGGQDLTDRKTNLRKVRQKMSMVFQSFNLFHHKMVIENVMMGPVDLLGMSRQEAYDQGVEYLKLVGLGEKLYAYPDELSGGQKQRVAIARCLAMKPEILLLDEPTSALDPHMVGEVQGVIRELARQGMTMMVVTHDMKFSREIANRVFYMDQGEIYEDGTPEEIFDHPKRERTRAFVKRLKTLEWNIESRDFDLYALNGAIAEFGRDHFMAQQWISAVQLVLEELIVQNLIRHTQKIRVNIGYYEVEDCVELSLQYGGGPFDPFDTEREDALSMLVVRQMTQEHRHQAQGEDNSLTLHLKSPIKHREQNP